MRVLKKTGATVQAHGMIYKALTKSVILYVSEIWVVMGAMLKVLVGFQHRTDMRIMEMMAIHGVGREWEYPPVVSELEAAVLHPIM